MKKLCLFITGILMPLCMLFSQIRPLRVGEATPDIRIKNIINHPPGELSLSDFAGKMILLDFWEITCSNCIKKLPLLDELNKRYGDRLQVITVTHTSTLQQMQDALRSIKMLSRISLPIVIQDTVLRKYFPYRITSHLVWIGADRKVKAITGHDYISEQNILSAISGEKLNWSVKTDALEYDYNQPLLSFAGNSLQKPQTLYYSSLMSSVNGLSVKTQTIVDTARNIITINYFNKSLAELCRLAVDNVVTPVNPKLLDIEIAQKDRIIWNGKSQYSVWASQNTYTYTVTLPLQFTQNERKAFIRHDIARWLESLFRIRAFKQRRKKDCLCLVKKPSGKKQLLTKGGTYYFSLLDSTAKRRQLINAPFSGFLWALNEETPGIPLVENESGIAPATLVDLELDIKSLDDITALRSKLNDYGLDLLPCSREQTIYVITSSDK